MSSKKSFSTTATVLNEYIALQFNNLMQTLSRTALRGEQKRNLNDICDYPEAVTVAEYEARYRDGDIAKRVVRLWPDETWRSYPEIYETEDDDKTEFEETWDKLEKRLYLIREMHHLDVLAGIGRFGVMFLGFSKGRPEEPVLTVDKKGNYVPVLKDIDLLYVQSFDETKVTIDSYETDTTNPRCGWPKFYSIKFGVDGENINEKKVHWSRVLHYSDNNISSKVFGEPRQAIVYKRLLDIWKIAGSAAEIFFLSASRDLAFEMDPEYIPAGGLDEEEFKKIEQQFTLFADKLKRYIAVQGGQVKSLSPSAVDPTPFIEIQLTLLAIAMDVPLRILKGTEEAKLAGEQDKSSWNGRVKRRQKIKVEPDMIFELVKRLQAVLVLPATETINVFWPDLFSPSEAENTEVAKAIIEALGRYLQMGVDSIIEPKQMLMQLFNWTEDRARKVLQATTEYLEDKRDEGDEFQREEDLQDLETDVIEEGEDNGND